VDSESEFQTTIDSATSRLKEASGAKKCWPCGCFHDAIRSLEASLPGPLVPVALSDAIQKGKEQLIDRRYDCLGCKVCFPALALNALNEIGMGDVSGCPTEPPKSSKGWPPLPGNYHVLRFQAPVAVCTLCDDALSEALAKSHEPGLSIVGTLHTENLGIERIIVNVVTDSHIRFLIVCGPDSRQSVGHLPGQSLLSLGMEGLDEKGRIIGALGKRPVIRNIGRDMVEHFRKTVTLIDMRGLGDQEAIRSRIRECAVRNPGPGAPFPALLATEILPGSLPSRMIPDPVGYFVIYPDPVRKILLAEHYQNTGFLDGIIEGRTPAEIVTTAIGRNFVSRMDHAAYLGQELARAEIFLSSGIPYVQDRAPEIATAPSAIAVSGLNPSLEHK